ncbi:hypothetical protein G3I13_01810 [Streptomyces sp. SID6673]|nr:hypothetical protein [Streptomyces sp. SID11726]NDZ94896.1 hypothetical protein [Streptomyces sp. SID11726]NEB23056.1 hypothetical protein [Streptomyces sp. SID6673]
MSKFKIGDRIRGNPGDDMYTITTQHATMEVIRHIGSVDPDIEVKVLTHSVYPGEVGSTYRVNSAHFELITKGEEVKPYQRKTYKQLKDSVTVKKGALWQEACDDGDQEYVLLDSAFNRDPRQTQRIYDRSLVEDDSKNFVEVFQVNPSYMTREELDRWEAFQKRKSGRKISDLPPVSDAPEDVQVVVPGSATPKPRYSHISDPVLTQFVGVWNSSRNVASVARKMNIKPASVLTYRAAALYRGFDLKTMRGVKPALKVKKAA